MTIDGKEYYILLRKKDWYKKWDPYMFSPNPRKLIAPKLMARYKEQGYECKLITLDDPNDVNNCSGNEPNLLDAYELHPWKRKLIPLATQGGGADA